MTARPTFPQTPDEPPFEDAGEALAGRKEARAERRQDRLEALSERGMGLADAASRRGCNDEAPIAAFSAATLAFTRVARCVRLTEALGDRLDNPQNYQSGRAGGGARDAFGRTAEEIEAETEAAARRVKGKIAQMIVIQTVEEAIETEAAERGDGFDVEEARVRLCQFAGGPEGADDCLDEGTDLMIARICKAIGLPYEREALGEDEDEDDPPQRPAARAPP